MKPIEIKILDYVKKNYSRLGTIECAKRLNISKNRCRHAASLVGVKFIERWTNAEVKILLDNINKPIEYLEKLLKRNRATIKAKCKRLNIIYKRQISITDVMIKKNINKKFISENYKNGYTQCANFLNVNVGTVIRYFKDIGIISTFKKDSWTQTEDDFIISNHKNIILCCQNINRSELEIKNRINLLGLEGKNLWVNKYRELNKLSNFDCYFLGYLWSDGYVSKNKITLNIIVSDSINILENLNMNDNWKVRYSGNQSTIYNSSTGFAEILTRYGFREKSGKDFNLLIDKLSDEQKNYFYRGLYDGDGCIYYNIKNGTYQCVLNSCYEQDYTSLENQLNLLEIKYKIDRKIRKRKDKKDSTYSYLRITSRSNVIKWCEYLYKNYEIDNIGLNRKYKKFIEIKNTIK